MLKLVSFTPYYEQLFTSDILRFSLPLCRWCTRVANPTRACTGARRTINWAPFAVTMPHCKLPVSVTQSALYREDIIVRSILLRLIDV